MKFTNLPLSNTHTHEGAWNTWWQRTRNYRPWGENVHRRVSYCARPHVRHLPQLLWPSSLTGTYLTVKTYLQTFLYERYLLHFSFSSETWIHEGKHYFVKYKIVLNYLQSVPVTYYMGIVLTLHYFQWKLEEEVCRIHSFILVLHTRERMLATFFLPVYRKQTTLPTLFFFSLCYVTEKRLFLSFVEVSKQWMFD